jgi:UDP-N-acetylglucosamine 2-epimerase
LSQGKLRLLTVVGTRPEIIRLSILIPLLDELFDHRLVHTGQNFDAKLSDVFFKDLGIREPDEYLNVGGQSLAHTIGAVMVGVEKTIAEFNPHGMMVLGDTNSALAAIIAKRNGVVLYHLEAGNRSFDINVPEETNRVLVDSISDFNMPYSEHARRNLLSEGHHPRNVAVTGSPMKEVLSKFDPKIQESNVLTCLNLQTGKYFLVSAHRQENIDDPDRLKTLLDSISRLSREYNVRCLVSTHPRLMARLEGLGGKSNYPHLEFSEPFGFFDFLRLQKEALCVLSDSGTISEEASILGFPAVTIRDSMERPEALEAASIILTGIEYAGIADAVKFQVNRRDAAQVPADYLVENFSHRVAGFVQSTLARHAAWSGKRT